MTDTATDRADLTVIDHITGTVVDLEELHGMPERLREAADLLHHYTGGRPVWVDDTGMYEALWVAGGGRYSILTDEINGTPDLMVLEERQTGQYTVLFRTGFADWVKLAQAAAAIHLGR